MLSFFSCGKEKVTAANIPRHVYSCMLQLYTARPCVEWRPMSRDGYVKRYASDTWVKAMMERLEDFRLASPGCLERVRLRALRPATVDGLTRWLLNPSWTEMSWAEVTQACWNSPEFAPNALHCYF